MGSFGPNNGSTFVDDSTVGTIAWVNPGNAQLNDGSNATAVLLLSQVTHYLKVTGFGFLIPSDATINGILVEALISATVNLGTSDSSIKLVQGGVISGNNNSAGAGWPLTPAYASYGSSSDLWGLSWLPADINTSTFGVAIGGTCGIASTAQIDHIRITVTYTGSGRIVTAPASRIQAGDGESVSN